MGMGYGASSYAQWLLPSCWRGPPLRGGQRDRRCRSQARVKRLCRGAGCVAAQRPFPGAGVHVCPPGSSARHAALGPQGTACRCQGTMAPVSYRPAPVETEARGPYSLCTLVGGGGGGGCHRTSFQKTLCPAARWAPPQRWAA